MADEIRSSNSANTPTNITSPTQEESRSLPPFLTQSQFSRERAKDQEDALHSLDETVLRPPIAPVDFEQKPPASPQAPEPVRRTHWRLAAAAIIAACLTGAVTAKALASRQSNVGLFGVQSVSEKLAEQIDGPVSHGETEDESVAEETSETDTQPEEETWTDEETSSPEEESSYPDWVYVSPRYNRNSTGDETSNEDDGSSYIDGDPYGLRMDDQGISYRYDGGGVSYDYDTRDITYDYGGGSITFDSDTLDEIERYLEENSSWDYYDWGYSDSRESDRGRTYDYGRDHGYIGGW